MKLAEKNKNEEKFEVAYSHYLAASKKLMELLKAEQDPNKQNIFKQKLEMCITEGTFLKVLIKDKK